jgi:imidazolonepropionase-like amidohydrolase
MLWTSFVAGLCLATGEQPAVKDAKSPAAAIVIEHINVIDTKTGDVKRDCRVILRGGQIESVGPMSDAEKTEGARVFNASGKYLIPGLWDMHVHIASPEYLPLFVLNGVTGVREMHAFFPDQIFQYRRDTASGKRFGPQIVAAGALIDGDKPFWPGSVIARNAKEGEEAVRSLKKKGADFIKVYSKLTPEAYAAIATECSAQNMVFAGHVPESVSARLAAKSGQHSMEHLYGILLACSDREDALRKEVMQAMATGDNGTLRAAMMRTQEKAIDSYNPSKAKAFFSLLVENGTWQDPTLVVLRNIGMLSDPSITTDARLKYLSPFVRSFWSPKGQAGRFAPERQAALQRIYRRDLQLVRDMHDAGVKFLAGTDTTNPYCMPGFSLHDELALLVGAGLSPLEALQGATYHAAEYLGLLDRYGTVSPGKAADLIVLDANPLEDIHNSTKIHAVIRIGNVLDRTELDRQLGEIEKKASGK